MIQKSLRVVKTAVLASLLLGAAAPQANAGLLIGCATYAGTTIFTFVPDRTLEREVRRQLTIPGTILAAGAVTGGIILMANNHLLFGIPLILLDAENDTFHDQIQSEIVSQLALRYPAIDDYEVLGKLASLVGSAAKTAAESNATLNAPLDVRFEKASVDEAVSGVALTTEVYRKILADFTN